MNNLTDISDMSLWNICVKQSIKNIYLNSCGILSLGSLSSYSELYELWCFDCHNLTSLDGLGNCKKLSRVLGQYCNLSNISGLSGCESLNMLFINNNPLTSLSGLQNCSLLNKLCASYCNLTNVSSLLGSGNGIGSLRYVDLAGNVDLEDVSSIAKCRNLNQLYLAFNEKMIENHVLNLESIFIQCGTNRSYPSKYSKLFLNDPIQNLTKSDEVTLNDYSSTIQALKNKSTKWLRLYGQSSLGSSRLASLIKGGQLLFSELENIKQNLTLTENQINYIDSLIELGENGVKNLSETQVNLENNSDIYLRYILSTLTSLQKLSLGNISNLTSIDFLNNVTGLYELDVRNTSVTDFAILETKALKLNTLALPISAANLAQIQTTLSRFPDNNHLGSGTKCCSMNKNWNGTTTTGLILDVDNEANCFSLCSRMTNLKINCNDGVFYNEDNQIDLSACTSLSYLFVVCPGNCRCYVKLPNTHFTKIQGYYSSFIDASNAREIDVIQFQESSKGIVEYILGHLGRCTVSELNFDGAYLPLDLIGSLSSSSSSLTTVWQGNGSSSDYYFGYNDSGRNVHGKLSSLNSFTNLDYIDASWGRDAFYVLEGLNETNTTNLKNVSYIAIRKNNIGNFNELKFLTGVETLVLTNNVISNLEGIGNLTNIEKLYLDSNKIENLSELENLLTTVNGTETTTLRELYLKSNPNLNATSESGYDNVALLQRLKAAGCTTISTDLNID